MPRRNDAEEAEHLKANPEDADMRSSFADMRSTVLIKHPKFATRRASIEHIPGKLDAQLVPGSIIEGSLKLPADAEQADLLANRPVRLQALVSRQQTGRPACPE